MRNVLGYTAGTFFGVGFIPIIPATWTSLAVALVYLAVPLDPYTGQLVFLAASLLLGVPACSALEQRYGKDPKQATIDEVAGMAITLLGVPITLFNVMVGFFLFRIFDVIKLPPARQLESLPAGWGIMADDVAAGIHARIVLAVILWLRGEALFVGV